MAIGREAIYVALFNQLQTLAAQTNPAAEGTITAAGQVVLPKVAMPPFQFADRRYRPVGDALVKYPALMLVEAGERYKRDVLGAPAAVTLVAYGVLQSAIGTDPNAIDATEINNLADAFEDAVETGAGQFQPGGNTLRTVTAGTSMLTDLALVCWISGRDREVIGQHEQRWSQQIMEIEIIATH